MDGWVWPIPEVLSAAISIGITVSPAPTFGPCAGFASVPGSVGLDVVATLLQEFSPQHVPVGAFRGADVVECGIDTGFHALEAAEIQIGVLFAQQGEGILAAGVGQGPGRIASAGRKRAKSPC
jgi:hypothetical protein